MNKRKLISIYITKEQYNYFKEHKEINKSELIRKLIQEYINEHIKHNTK